MNHFPSRLVCVLLAASFFTGAMVVRAEGEYVLSFDDPQEYPENPDADLKSLESYLVDGMLVIELTTYGNISSEPGYDYSVSNYDIYESSVWFSFCLYAGNGTFNAMAGDNFVEVDGTWNVSNGTLTLRFPAGYAGSPDTFNLTASASYVDLDDFSTFVADNINLDDSIDLSYDFDNAEPLSVPASISDSLGEGESRIYSMDLDAGAGVLIVLNGSLGDMPSLMILNSEEQYVTGSMSMTRNARMTFIPDEVGTYYLVIDSWSVSGSYDLSTSFRGASGEAYERVTPERVPWQTGDEWSAGGYISMDELLDQLFEEAGAAGIMYSMMFPQLETEGGIADFLIVTYAGEEGGQYRFDFKCRLYADITLNMTTVTGSEAYVDDEPVSEYTDTMFMNASGTVDLQYNGSVWLGYYENGEGGAYYGVEKEAIDLTGSLDVYMGMADYMTYSDMEDMYFSSESRMWGTIEMGLRTENTPGIPYLPAGDGELSVDKKASTTYDGSMDVDMWMDYEYSDMEEYPGMEPEGMNETLDSDFNGSYVGYYILEYDQGAREAGMTPLMTDPFTFLMIATSKSYAYVDEEPYPYWLDYGNSKADYDPKTGFYTTFELPLNPLSGTAMSLGGEDGGESSIESLGILSVLSNLAMSDVSQDDADAFFEDPAGFISAKEDGAGSSEPVLLILGIIVGIVVVIAVTLLVVRRKPGMPLEPAREPEMEGPQ